jgi:diguanylate cyclase (GGDEF)-like protein
MIGAFLRQPDPIAPRRAPQFVVALLMALATANAVWSVVAWRWSPPTIVENTLYQLVAWSAVVLAWIPVLTRRHWQVAPIAITITLWTAGDLVWAIAEQLGVDRGPGLADVAYLAGYPVLAIGIWRLVRRVSDAEARAAAILDGLLVAATAGVLLWRFFGAPAYRAGETPFARLIDAGYPMLDVVLVACCVWLAFTPARSRQLMQLGGLVGIALVADVLYIAGDEYSPTGLQFVANALYPIAYLCGAAACWSLATTPEGSRSVVLHRGRVVLLGVAFAVLPISYALAADATLAGAGIAAIAATLAFARMAGAAISADRRHGELDRVVHDLEHTRAALSREATLDALTGLANRRALVHHLGTACGTRSPSVVFCDLDRFKPINDGYGHHAGDALLVAVARRLERLDADLVARLGGDEFVLVVDDGDPVRTRVVAAGTLACVSGPVDIEAMSIEISGSVGVASSDGVGDDPSRLLRDADLAMYAAKSAGGSAVAHFEPAMSRLAEARTRIEVALRATIAGTDGHFALAWQPIVGTHGSVVGREALLRWWHDDRWHAPAEFVAIAEEAGLLGQISQIVLHRACDALSRQATTNDPTIVAVNISGSQLTSPDFVGFVSGVIAQHGVDPAQLCIEVTEETLAGSVQLATTHLLELAELGVRLAIDDFGAGATSIAHLRQLPFHYVKLDRAFVAAVESDPLERRLLADLIQLIHGIGRVVVVEGIETASEERAARNAGADLFQGFRFGRPMLDDSATEALDVEHTEQVEQLDASTH